MILIAIPPQQWLHERSSLLWYAYVACLVCNTNTPGNLMFIGTCIVVIVEE